MGRWADGSGPPRHTSWLKGAAENDLGTPSVSTVFGAYKRDTKECDRHFMRVQNGDLSRQIGELIRVGRWADGSGPPRHTSWLKGAAENDLGTHSDSTQLGAYQREAKESRWVTRESTRV